MNLRLILDIIAKQHIQTIRDSDTQVSLISTLVKVCYVGSVRQQVLLSISQSIALVTHFGAESVCCLNNMFNCAAWC